MSAFAARQQLWGAAAARAGNSKSLDEKAADKTTEKTTLQPAPEDDAPRTRRTRSETPSSRPLAGRTAKRQPTEEPAAANQAQTEAQTQGIDTAGEDEARYVGFSLLSLSL